MQIKVTSDLWWKNAVVYCLDVETFLDGNGDGIGDFAGLTSRIDYLAGLGITCLWLMPFYPSPQKDDGYDIADFYNVHPALGSLGDFVEFMRTAKDRGLRVIIDLVVNHTSNQHPWFQSARADRNSPYRDFYIWLDERPKGGVKELVFPGDETSNWAYDRRAGQYYFHSFYRHQPDLNIDNPAVRDEINKIIGFWIQLGVSGFRVDAVPFLIESFGTNQQEHEQHKYLRNLRSFMSRRLGNAILLGEVNLEPKEMFKFFGGEDGDELHLILNFFMNQALILALAREEAAPLEQAIDKLPQIAVESEWANFARNHDELSLDKLTEEERQEVFALFGPDKSMQMYGRGIRRRLPTMLNGDERRLRLVYSIMFSLPGIPTIFYGEEIGLVENLAIEGRYAVRVPMQWSNEAHAGFSPAWVKELCRPIVTDPRFSPDRVNVADQRRDPDSLLNWMERLIRQRKERPELGWGRYQRVETTEPAIFAHRCDWDEAFVLTIHNLGPRRAITEVPVGRGEELVEIFADQKYEPVGEKPGQFEVAGYGYRWFRVQRDGQRILA
ncbi:MAG: alpha-amylase family protein [Thermomicrobiales bacterium]